jgi:hypothetical protein
VTSFATVTDVSLAELHLDAFLPADEPTAQYLRERELQRRGGSQTSWTRGLVDAAVRRKALTRPGS